MSDFVSFLLKLPPGLHKRLKEVAERDGRSLQQEILHLLAVGVDNEIRLDMAVNKLDALVKRFEEGIKQIK